MSTYLMTPELYHSLCNVRGFTNLNGETYQSHIIIILNISDNDLKNEILETTNDKEALNVLIKYHVKFHH